jgi:hypothetical protein
LVAVAGGRLVTVSMYARRLTPASTAAFERVVNTLRLN